MQIIRLNINGIGIPISFKDKQFLSDYIMGRIKGAEIHQEGFLKIDVMLVDIADDVAAEDEEQAIMDAMTKTRKEIALQMQERTNYLDDRVRETDDQLSKEFGKEM